MLGKDVVLPCATHLGLSRWFLLCDTMFPLHYILMELCGGCPTVSNKAVCVGFLYIEVWRLPSSMGVIRICKRGMDPSGLVSSLVNFILGLMVFKCSRKLFLCCFLMIVNVSSTNLFQSTGDDGYVMMAWTSRSSINRLATMGLICDPIAAPSVCS